LGLVVVFTGLAAYQRILLPGDGVLRLSANTSYTVYYESRSGVAGRRYDTGTVHGPGVRAARPVCPRSPCRSSAHNDSGYTLGGYSGEYVYGFCTAADRYSLTCSYAEQADKPIVLALTDNTGPATAVLIGTFATVSTGIAIALGQRVRRSRSANQRPPRDSSPPDYSYLA
jgi:hypothetical protein